MFECYVAKNIWNVCSELFDKNIGTDFESVARWWLCDKNFKVLNICTTAVMWSIWKLRNEICFQGVKWMGMQVLLFKCAQMLRSWKILHKPEVATQLETWQESWRGEDQCLQPLPGSHNGGRTQDQDRMRTMMLGGLP
jgi:hypothetical protein